jgi:hypothetical protein
LKLNKTLIEVKKIKNKEIHNEFNNNSYYNNLIEIFEYNDSDDDDYEKEEVKPLLSIERNNNYNAMAALLLKLL